MGSTIKVVPLSLQERGEKIVETAVSNDDRPESFLAAHDSRRIDHDEKGIPYLQKGAASSSLLLKAVGPPPMAIKMALPHACPSRHGFKWAVIDGCWTTPTSNVIPLERIMFVDPSPWVEASRVADKVLRYGGKCFTFKEGGWADAYSVFAAVSHDFKRRHPTDIVRKIASTSWLFALMSDTPQGSSVKSRYQLAGVVDNDGILVQICYVRNKSGHGDDVAKLIPGDFLYTKIIEENLKHISCICHKTKFENLKYL